MPISQPSLVLAFALAFGLIVAAAIGARAFTRTRKARVLHISACAVGIIFLGRVLTELNLRFNFTPSMPLGVYRLTPAPPKGELPRDTIVAACAPRIAAEVGRRRGYLAAGRCPGGTELLLKIIVAARGDDVVISGHGVSVNGCALPHSRQRSFDVAGRRLSRWPEGHYLLRGDELWLYGANDRSWDSRYWGPAAMADVMARAVPLFTAPLLFRSTSSEPRCGRQTPLDRIPGRRDSPESRTGRGESTANFATPGQCKLMRRADVGIGRGNSSPNAHGRSRQRRGLCFATHRSALHAVARAP
jgi:conjugative transfer signal peptidase TraF